MRLILFVLILPLVISFSAFTQEEVVEDHQMLTNVQKLFIDHGFTTRAALPTIIYHKTTPSHFIFGQVGQTNYKEKTIEILICNYKEFDKDTFFHECYHWFVADETGKGEAKEIRAERFALICLAWFKNNTPKGIVENSK